jgi:hypothetical protein
VAFAPWPARLSPEIVMTLSIGLDSYADLDDLCAVASDYGHGPLIEATDDLVLEGWARQATMFLDNAYAWVGVRSVPGQPLAWPRSGAVDQDGLVIPPDLVPSEIIVAQSLLMVAAGAGELAGSTGGSDRAVIRESADDASIEYAAGSADRKFPMVSGLIRHLTTSHLMGSFRQLMAARG